MLVLGLLDGLQRWLHNRPGGPLEIGAPGGGAMASLLCCWSATVMHSLAREPLTLAELDRAVEPIPEREVVAEHVEGMRRVGQVEVLEVGGETRYALTDWMREGIAPIAAAASVEDPETWATGSPLDWLDTLVDPAAGKIKAGGDTRLAEALIGALHERLFTPAQLTPPGR